ncbi:MULTISPECIES: polyprenyl synthetase family protein [unclassified Gordonia (in: high G+C Gram-positive bacteria)]|uniref:polyprenyl synthetase family protein n=1 Tax=unclassified Gordonia (in: high G+C Gram-positive bacteria) TaxID=2657482 RepID=UPI001F058E16|nr:polyprenyl synthetase family protein [Gordonia sp. PDNC005]
MVNLTELPAAVDDVLDGFFQATAPILESIYPTVGEAGDALRDFVMTGGKRVRPLFVFAGRQCASTLPTSAGGDKITMIETPEALHETLRVCAAIELIQACALVHDDILDRSDTRRQNPTVHRRFEAVHADRGWSSDSGHYGDSAAILIGDMALAWADDLFHGAMPTPDAAYAPPHRPIPFAATAVWSRMRTEVLAGQFLDITNEVSGDESLTAAERVMAYKTAAYTVARPLELGATLGGASPELCAELHGLGIDLGIAFQLRDDLLGVFGDPAETGKPSGDDLVAGKRTALLAVALDAASDADARLLRNSIGRPIGDAELTAARDVLVRSGAVAEIERQIADRRDAGLARIDALDCPAGARTDLTSMAHRVTSRSK